MKKYSVLGIILMISLSIVFILFKNNIYNISEVDINTIKDNSQFLKNDTSFKEGVSKYNNGVLRLKIKTDNGGSIKEILITERPAGFNDDDEIVMQKLLKQAIDKNNTSEIEDIKDNTVLSFAFKNALNNALGIIQIEDTVENYEKVSLNDFEIASKVLRTEKQITKDSIKTGFGTYIINSFFDSSFNKNGNLVTHEYLCAIVQEQNGRISQVQFDHIASNISFNRNGKVPTGSARAYNFLSDKMQPGYNGLCSDGNLINFNDLERQVLDYRTIDNFKNTFEKRNGYLPFINALQNAIDNAKYYGANKDDTLGYASYKELNKKNIKDASAEGNGKVVFYTNYVALTVNRKQEITSCIFDLAENPVNLTFEGKILGSRDAQIYTVNTLSNIEKYSKIDKKKVEIKKELIDVSTKFENMTIQNAISLIDTNTDIRGQVKEDGIFAEDRDLDFIKYIDMLSNAFVNSRLIK